MDSSLWSPRAECQTFASTPVTSPLTMAEFLKVNVFCAKNVNNWCSGQCSGAGIDVHGVEHGHASGGIHKYMHSSKPKAVT